jgi:hypothetical protein
MSTRNFIILIKYYGVITCAVGIIACNIQSNKALTVESDLAIFRNLAMAEAGLDFPPTKDHLETCRRVNDIPCLRSFNSFNESKTALQQMPRDDALDLTLKQLAESCIVNASVQAELTCAGSVMALYFFSEEAEDLKIREYLSQLPQSTRDNVLDSSASLRLCWLENRSDETVWRSWLESRISNQRIRSHAIQRIERPAPQSDPLQKFPYNPNGN